MTGSNNNSVPPRHPFSNLWAFWEDSTRKRDKLALRAAHKALDIPEDDMDIRTEHKHGIGGAGAVGIALAAGLPVAALAGMMLWKNGDAPAAEPPQLPTTKTKVIENTKKERWKLGPETVIPPDN